MNYQELKQRFSNETICRDYLFKKRWSEGIICNKCKGTHFYKITTRNLYECKCGHQMSVTSGTIMHRSHTPLRKWFLAIFLVRHCIPIRCIMQELKVAYQTAWSIKKKINDDLTKKDSIVRKLLN